MLGKKKSVLLFTFVFAGAVMLSGCSILDSLKDFSWSKLFPPDPPPTPEYLKTENTNLADDIIVDLPKPEYNGKRPVKSTLLITADYHGKNKDLLLNVDLSQTGVNLEGMTPDGKKLFTASYTRKDGLLFKKEDIVPLKDLPPINRMILDTMLCFYPAEDLNKSFPEGTMVKDTYHKDKNDKKLPKDDPGVLTQRQVIGNSVVLYLITYNKNQMPDFLIHYTRGYSLTIKYVKLPDPNAVEIPSL